MKLWAINGVWSLTYPLSREVGGIMWTVVATTEEEALGFVYKGMRSQNPDKTVESLYATDISNVARDFSFQYPS